MYPWTSNDEEFEPRPTTRGTPRPAPKINWLAAPTVPEVSLVFENSGKYGGGSPGQSRIDAALARTEDSSRDSKDGSLRNEATGSEGTYAAWREQNFTGCRMDEYTPTRMQRSRYPERKVAGRSEPAAGQPTHSISGLTSEGTCGPSHFDTDDRRHILQKPYPCVRVNAYRNPMPQFYADNQETVKNLLQLVSSQNEQIKALQSQVDRLLKMQEESFKERRRCNCTVPSEYSRAAGAGASMAAVEPSRASRKPASPRRSNFVEQNVSIGVMTSFEFTLQNSPFADEYANNEIQRQVSQENLGESLRRYKNTFARIPAGHHLENIVEDSESYLSSQRQSSNLNGSLSTRDPLERQNQPEQREVESGGGNPRKCYTGIDTTCEQSETGKAGQLFEGKQLRKSLWHPKYNKKGEFEKEVEEEEEEEEEKPEEEEKKKKKKKKKAEQPKNTPPVLQDCARKSRQQGKVEHTGRKNCVEDSLVLSGGDLRVAERPPPTPEPSIHVEMQEYSSDEESDKPRRSSKVGWTFYNNVLGQVNHILRNSCVIDEQNQGENPSQEKPGEQPVPDSVKLATLEQLRKLGISLTESPDSQREVNGNVQREFLGFDSSFYPRLDRQANLSQPSTTINETNTSMHMKALALKYLSDEQLGELALQRQGSVKAQLMVSNLQGTNMSFATMRYLERYQLLPGASSPAAPGPAAQEQPQPQLSPGMNTAKAKGTPAYQRFTFGQTPRTTCPSKILDISTLKQQPKLL